MFFEYEDGIIPISQIKHCSTDDDFVTTITLLDGQVLASKGFYTAERLAAMAAPFAAGLTILRAFVAAGRPGLAKLPPFGSFESWSNLVRGALVWLGEPDPCLTREHIVADDPVKSKLAAFFAAVYNAMGDRSFTASELLKMADDQANPNPELEDIVHEAVPKGNSIALGVYLKSNESKIIGGLTLLGEDNKHKKIREYKMKAV